MIVVLWLFCFFESAFGVHMHTQHGRRGVRHECRRAVTFVSKLNGGSQPCEIMTTGAILYVVKFRQFTGKYGLMNEVIGTEMMSRIGLPVPGWAPIEVTDEFLDANREVWRQKSDGSAKIRPGAGLHFGSRLMLSPGKEQTYEVLPSSWVPRIINRDDFVGALLIDLWLNNCDRRQAIFLSSGQPRLHAMFLDNDHMLGGYFGDEKTNPRRVMASTLPIYRACWQIETINRWRKKIDAVDDASVDEIVSSVPEAWATQAMRKHAAADLKTRRRRLDGLIEEVAGALAVADRPALSAPILAARVRWGALGHDATHAVAGTGSDESALVRDFSPGGVRM